MKTFYNRQKMTLKTNKNVTMIKNLKVIYKVKKKKKKDQILTISAAK